MLTSVFLKHPLQTPGDVHQRHNLRNTQHVSVNNTKLCVCVCSGQTPAVSDKHLLEAACRLEMYGMRLQPAKDRDRTRLSLAAAHNGVLVFQVRTNTSLNSVLNVGWGSLLIIKSVYIHPSPCRPSVSSSSIPPPPQVLQLWSYSSCAVLLQAWSSSQPSLFTVIYRD